MHGLLASHCADETGTEAGKSLLKAGDQVKFNLEHPLLPIFKQQQGVDINEMVKSWNVLCVVDDEQSGYCGVIYQNINDRQLVLSQRSTNFLLSVATQNIGKQSGAQADIESVVMGNIGLHQAHAYRGTKIAVELAKNMNFSLSITGHSLGAYLAELSVFYCHMDLNFKNVKAVSFDGPGSLEMMKQLSANQVQGSGSNIFDPKELDITRYTAGPNLVNCANKHVGRSYRLFPKLQEDYKFKHHLIPGFLLHKLNALAYTLSHDLIYIMPYFNVKTGKPFEYEMIVKWPSITHSNFGKIRKTSLTSDFIRKIDAIVKSIVGSSQFICKGMFISESSTLACILGVLTDFYNNKIDDKEFWQIHKLLNSDNKMTLPKQVQEITLESSSEDIINSFGIAYKANYLTC